MAEKKPEPKAEPAKPKAPETGDQDPLANFPDEVEGGRWEYDETTGDRRWVADESK